MGQPDPPWLRHAWHVALEEWIAYSRVLLAVTLRPRQFMRAWALGESSALNPLACILNAAALLTGANALLRLRGHADEMPDWYDLVAPAVMLINSAGTVSLLHFPLKLFGARGQWRTSFAASLFVASGPGLVLSLIREVVLPIHALQPGFEFAAGSFGMIAIATVTVLTFGYLALALAGAQRVRLWRVGAAFAVSAGLVTGIDLFLKHFHLVR